MSPRGTVTSASKFKQPEAGRLSFFVTTEHDTFNHGPGATIAVAADKDAAAHNMGIALNRSGLHRLGKWHKLKQVSLKHPVAEILYDGNNNVGRSIAPQQLPPFDGPNGNARLFLCNDHDHVREGRLVRANSGRVASYVVAGDEEQARELLDACLRRVGAQEFSKVPYTFFELDLWQSFTEVMYDGT
jgi:hypothetical protein